MENDIHEMQYAYHNKCHHGKINHQNNLWLNDDR